MKVRTEEHLKEGYTNFVFIPETEHEKTMMLHLALSYSQDEIGKLEKAIEVLNNENRNK